MELIDLDKLIKPITNNQLTGCDLRHEEGLDSFYFQIKDARFQARQCERLHLQKQSDDNGHQHWDKVYSLGCEILEKYSKDLEIAAWLIEAMLRKFSLAGLNVGFKLIYHLVEKYWDQLHPSLDEDAIELKISAFLVLNGEDSPGSLIQPIATQVITAGNNREPFALWQYKQALAISQLQDPVKQAKRFAALGFSLEDIKQAVKETPTKFFDDLNQSLNECLESLEYLEEAFALKCKNNAPSAAYIREALIDLKDHLGLLLEKPIVLTSNIPGASSLANDNPALHLMTVEGTSTGERTNALQALITIAKFFENTEPHSPLPYLLRRAVHWGNLSLPELYQELISDDESRNKVFKLTGISIPEK